MYTKYNYNIYKKNIKKIYNIYQSTGNTVCKYLKLTYEKNILDDMRKSEQYIVEDLSGKLCIQINKDCIKLPQKVRIVK